MQRTALAILALISTFALPSCSAADKVQNKVSCSTVCNRYKDCFDSNYDVGKCTDNCESQADTNGDKDRKLDECNSCIGGQSCTGAAFNCATQCSGIIVQ